MSDPSDARSAVLANLLGRRTIHSFRRDPVDDRTIEDALLAAVHAPNHRMTAPWRFVRVGRETRAQLAEIAVRIASKPGLPHDPAKADDTRRKLLDPHDLIVVSIVKNDDAAIAREDYASAACAIGNLSLALWACGIGAKWGTGRITRDAATHALLGIDPAREEIVGFVQVGVPASVPATPPRPALASLVRRLP
ncbi:MAG: nitroreductase [Planctomycetes bacterium]|nr:nitroreductase [Planctomycetota bacterium]